MSLAFPSKSGCPMCGIVSRAAGSESTPTTPTSISTRPRSRNGKEKEKDSEPEVIWHDENFTVYVEHAHPVSSAAHLVIIFNLHVPSLYMLSTSDVPLLVKLRDLAHRLLTDLTSHMRYPPSPTSPASRINPSSPSSPPPSQPEQPGGANGSDTPETGTLESQFRVGFITPPFKDSQIPVKDHLHAHAYVAPMDRCGWWRSVAYSPIAWYAIEDLIAEIREESSNNRIRSSSSSGSDRTSTSSLNGRLRPIDRVPNAGARSGTADGHETTARGIIGIMEMNGDLEAGGRASSGSAYGYALYNKSRRNANGTENEFPVSSPNASSSRLSFRGYSGVASTSSPKLATPTSSTFAQAQAESIAMKVSNPPRTPESRPGSSLAPTGNLLSPACTAPSSPSSS